MTWGHTGWRWRDPAGNESGVYAREADARAAALWQALAEIRAGGAPVAPEVLERLWDALAAKGWQVVEAGS